MAYRISQLSELCPAANSSVRYMYRKLLLAFAVTIHKCQGLSLDCAIVDLSSDIFATGMANVAMSQVRTLAGLYVLAFDQKCIKVSTECIEEVNRLRKLFKRDLPSIEVSNVPKSTPRVLTSLTQVLK